MQHSAKRLVILFVLMVIVAVPGALSQASQYESFSKALESGNSKQALEIADAFVKAEPNNYLAYRSRANAHGMLKHWPQALADFSKALELNDKDISSYTGRAFIYIQMNKPALAINDCNKGLALDPKRGMLYCNRGEAYLKQGDATRAIADFNLSIKLVPTLGEAYFFRAAAYDKLKMKKEAQADRSKALELGYHEDSPAVTDGNKVRKE